MLGFSLGNFCSSVKASSVEKCRHRFCSGFVICHVVNFIKICPFQSQKEFLTPTCTSMQGEAENSRTTFSYNTTVIGGHIEDNFLHLHIYESKGLQNGTNDAQLLPQFVLIPRLVINAAGLCAVPLAKRFHGINQGILPTAYYARGCYFTLSKTKTPFSHLIYPLPEDGGLGVHVTLDLIGIVKFGPDVEWIDGVDDISCFTNR